MSHYPSISEEKAIRSWKIISCMPSSYPLRAFMLVELIPFQLWTLQSVHPLGSFNLGGFQLLEPDWNSYLEIIWRNLGSAFSLFKATSGSGFQVLFIEIEDIVCCLDLTFFRVTIYMEEKTERISVDYWKISQICSIRGKDFWQGKINSETMKSWQRIFLTDSVSLSRSGEFQHSNIWEVNIKCSRNYN